MSDETNESTTSDESADESTEQMPTTGIEAAKKLMADHWAKKDQAKTQGAEKTPEEKPAPQQQPKPKKAGIVKALKEERAARKAAADELNAMKARLAALEGKGQAQEQTPPKGISKERWLESLLEAGVDESEALDALQKRAMEHGGVPPAVAKLVDKQAATIAALEAKLQTLEQGLSSKEEAAAHEAGWRALASEAKNVQAYPELDGWGWEELEPVAEQAVSYLMAQGKQLVKPGEVMGLVNSALKAQREQMEAKIAAKKPAAEPPKAPPKKAAKAAPAEEEELEPIKPGKRGKVRLPTDAEVMRRIQARHAM